MCSVIYDLNEYLMLQLLLLTGCWGNVHMYKYTVLTHKTTLGELCT